MKKILWTITILIAILLPIPVFAEDATIQVTPSIIDINPSDVFSISIVVNPSVPIAGMQVSLSYNPAIISIVSVTEGNLFNQYGDSTYFVNGNIDSVNGNITDIVGVITGAGKSISNSGNFATINVIATGAGNANISLENVIIGDTSGEPVSFSVVINSIIINGESTPTIPTIPTTEPTVPTVNPPPQTKGNELPEQNKGLGGYEPSYGESIEATPTQINMLQILPIIAVIFIFLGMLKYASSGNIILVTVIILVGLVLLGVLVNNIN